MERQSLTKEMILRKREEYPLFQEDMFSDWKEEGVLAYLINNDNFERRYWQSDLTVDVSLYIHLFRGPKNSKDPALMDYVLGLISLFDENRFETPEVFPTWTNWKSEYKKFDPNLGIDKNAQRYMWLYLFTHPNELLKLKEE